MQFKKFVKIRKEKFGGVIFDTLREKVFVTNESGAEILNLLDEKKNPQEIPQILSSKFKADKDEIKGDVGRFIQELKEKDLFN